MLSDDTGADANAQALRGNTLQLHFNQVESPELVRVDFKAAVLSKPVTAVRGKTAGAFLNAVTFQWTSAVRALSILLLRGAALAASVRCDEALLIGGNDSPAGSLDAAMEKQPIWLSEIFGFDSTGAPLCRKIIKRTNPARRYPGPVTLSLNTSFLEPQNILVILNGFPLTELSELEALADQIERHWRPRITREIGTFKALSVANAC